MSGGPAGVALSVAIMHHPARPERLRTLVESCAPFRPRVVVDPDPGGVPSPLRTAKRAWAAVGDDATHHLVLQDDVALAAGFAVQVDAAIRARPGHAVALYVNWNSPQNAYLTRRAAVSGSPWAPLSPWEWTPTQGLVMPADRARQLAVYLSAIPDEVKDDDEMVAVFCRSHGVPVVAAVPHLVEHADGPTLAGHPGSYHGVVYADHTDPVPPVHWRGAEPLERRLAGTAGLDTPMSYTVELRSSRCLIRLVRPAQGEPVEHLFGWRWYEWSSLIGVDPDEIADAFRGLLTSPAGEVALEVFAAAYLLGHDAGPADPRLGARWASITRAAIASWVDSGLVPDDQPAGDAERTDLIGIGVAGLNQGRETRADRRPAPLALVRSGDAR